MDREKAVAAWQTLTQAASWLIIPHYNPDGDAISSVNIFLELAAYLNKPAVAYCADLPSATFNFLAGSQKITNQLSKEQFDNFSAIIVVDCGSVSRTKIQDWLLNRQPEQKVVEFDHHEMQDDYADVSFKENQAAATVEIIYDFLIANNLNINTEIAKSILTGLVTDTGNFLYSNTTNKTTEIAARMMLSGARLPKIISQTLASKNLAVMRLWGKILSCLKINPKYLVAVAIIRQTDMVEFGLNMDDLSGLIGLINSLQGINGSLLLVEAEDGTLKGSLRTNQQDVDISILASFLGGGGHRKASGFSLPGQIIDNQGELAII
ncbi:MAG TPA: bifunctional oligoribonuclease/PAP phosphatase NrnA [bacterium]|nr:bifunctional oligoribonuclease/PAP phosphatase NrnA [bacterium]